MREGGDVRSFLKDYIYEQIKPQKCYYQYLQYSVKFNSIKKGGGGGGGTVK